MVMFYESYYLANNADVAEAVKAGYFSSGWEHYVHHGWLENRSFSAPTGYGAFNEDYYLANNPDVAFAVQEGYFATGWQHYVIHGQAEGRSSAMPAGYNDFNETYYLTNNPDVAEAVEDGIFLSGWHHYSWTGRLEGRTYAQPVGYGDFSEYYYLLNNPDVAAAVDADYFTSGWQHYVVHGQSEGRSFAAPTFTVGTTTIENGGEMPTLAPIVTPNLFTLTEVYVGGTEGTPPVKEVYWGYTPCTDCQDPEGIPVSELLDFVATITGLDLTELGLIDDDGVGPFDNVTSLSLSMGNISNENETQNDDGSGVVGGDSTLTITFADGTSVNAEAYLGENYMQFLRDLIFYEDKDGNLHSRLFEKVVEEGTSGTSGYYEPLVLTPKKNNGSTVENPVYHLTTSGDDRIVAGRLELLHGAYIDGGGGNNTLEIDAKGVYAQPLSLVNIQHVLIENLPNIYTTTETLGSGSGEWIDVDSDYPYWNDSDLGVYANSIIDLSRAIDIETLTITESRFDGFAENNAPGSLTVAGIRNGVTTTLDGGFSQNVYLHYSAVSDDDGVNIELHNMNMAQNAQLVVAHNADTLNIDSTGGGNRIYNADLGGLLSKMVITGDAHLYIDNDLDPSFHDASPVTIDASANTGGVTLTLTGSQDVTVMGSHGDDVLKITTDESGDAPLNDEVVTIIGGEGDNSYEVHGAETVIITNGDGDNNYEVDYAASWAAVSTVSITSGDGDNHYELANVAASTITAGDGDNRIEIISVNSADFTDSGPSNAVDYVSSATVVAGNGNNIVDLSLDTNIGTASITLGDGGNDVDVLGASVSITTGAGADDIRVEARDITVIAGGDNNTVTVVGFDEDYTDNASGNTNNAGAPYASDAGAKLVINAGSNSTVILGSGQDPQYDADDEFPGIGSITAKEGSSITGTNVKLVVDSIADLRAADLSGITSVVLDDDASSYAASSKANDVINPDTGLPSNGNVNRAVLTLTASQLLEIGADAFSVDGSVFNTHAYVRVIVDQNTSLSALGVNELPRNIDLLLEVQDGVTLTMTAEQLHTKVAPQGVTLAWDGNTDVAAGKVVITNGGDDFDPFNTSDTVKTIIGGNKYYGGSLSSDFAVDGTDAGTVAGDSMSEWYNVTVTGGYGGYNRPADAPVEVVYLIDGDKFPTVGAHSTWNYNIEIIGSDDVVFTGAGNYGMMNGSNATPFVVDFSQLEGQAIGLTLGNFENVGAVYGNSGNGYTSVVYVELDHPTDKTVGIVGGSGEPNVGLVSSGVSKYIVTKIGGPTAAGSTGNTATIVLCDTTQDLEVMTLRGNYNDTLEVIDAAWDLAFELQGGTTAKADGPTGTANVGKLVATYEWDGADAVVALTHSVAGDTRVIKTYGITINNADSISIDVVGSALIDSVAGNSVEDLDIDATGNVDIVATLPAALETIDAAGVLGTFAVSVDPADDFTFVGSAGGSTLTITDDFDATDDTSIDGGVGGLTLVIAEDQDVDLDAATLTNITSVVLEDDSTLELSIAQAAQIGAANFIVAEGDAATLNLTNLDSTLFVRPDFDADIDVAVVSVAALPSVTLNAGTNLTGIGGLAVHEGTTLNLTAAQFQQLDGNGDFDIIVSAATGDKVTVNITGLTAADVEGGFSLIDIPSAVEVNLILAESVDLSDAVLTGVDSITFGDNMTLTLGDIQDADGVAIVGGANSVLKFLDTSATAFESIDASGFNVTTMKILNVLVANRNVDLMFLGLAQTIIKDIYNDLGWVEGQNQYVVLEEGTTIPGWVVFNKPEADAEIRHFYLTMSGGTEISGNLRLSASDNEEDLLQTDLQTVTITSEGTAENLITGNTANIITGQLTSQGMGPQGTTYDSVDNDLLNVVITATQALEIRGGIVFESVVGNDAITANDDDEAVATLTVNGTADVSLGVLDTSDTDVDALNVINNGTGTLSLVIDGDSVNADDVLSFTGTGDIELTIENEVDLSDDVLTAVSQITLADNTDLTLTQAQFDALGAANLLTDATPSSIYLYIVELGTDPFDATAIAPGITVDSVTIAAGTITLNPATNLTGVGEILVPEGSTLTLTAAQFQQLQGTGTIRGIDTDGDNTDGNLITVNITGLTQADIDYDVDNTSGETDGFSLIGIDDDATVNITLAEDVNLAANSELRTYTTSAAGYALVTVTLAAGQTMGIASYDQANGLNVNGGANSTLVFQYVPHTTYPGQIDASGYNVTTLKALAAGFTVGGNANVEYSIDDLPSSVILRLYEDPADLGFLDPTYRVVIIEEGITTPTGLIFNDWDDTDEVRTLGLTLEGDVVLNGNLSIPTRTDKDGAYGTQQYFNLLTINSVGTDPNTIDGDINTNTVLAAPNTSENNLLNVVINASQELEVTGTVIFRSIDVPDDDAVANLSVNGSADVTIKALNTTDVDINTLNVANNGTGLLTLTGGSDALEIDNTETLVFTGTGDILLDTDTGAGNNGIDGTQLSLIDASGLSGDLTLGVIEDIDSANFEFISGSGVTKLTISGDALTADFDGVDNILGTDDDQIGWNFDLSDAAAGSELHLGAALTFATVGAPLNIDLGPNATLYIDATMDLTNLDLSIIQTLPIVLADGATLTLTAAQADGLTIIAGPDVGAAGFTGVVNIVDLGDTPVDLGGIAADIAGIVTLEDNDVTLDVATDLGFFAVQLDELADTSASLAGQTIRFQTVAQAEREIIVNEAIGNNNDSSTNVVWLFTSITNPNGVDTADYDQAIGRLWFSEDLVNNEGGLVESLFTTLPSTILRVDFTDLTALNILLASNAIDRTMEFVNFANVGNLKFEDIGANPEEHVRNLALKLGGEVTLGNIMLDDLIAGPDTDPDSVEFQALFIESHRALHEDHILAAEAYLNDNDGTAEYRDGIDADTDNDDAENTLPDNINTIGNIGVDTAAPTNANIDLLSVFINTLGISVEGGGLLGSLGANINIGTITYDSEVAASTALLDVTGANDINIAAVIATDPQISTVTVDATGFTGVLTAPGTSPGFQLGANGAQQNVETLNFDNDDALAGTITLGSATHAGIYGDDLSFIDAEDFDGTLNLGVVAMIDGTNDDRNTDGDTTDAGDAAFTFTSGDGITTMTLGLREGVAPTLTTDSQWIFTYTGALPGSSLTITDDVTFQADAILTLTNVPLIIEGDVDLSDIILNISGGSIWVPAGQSLTLDVTQLAGIPVDIVGDGTIILVGDATSLILGDHLRTVNLDLTAVTIDTGVDVDLTVDLLDVNAIDDNGDPAGFVILGSAFADNIDVSESTLNTDSLGSTVTGNGGDDIINTQGIGGSSTFIVNSGTDTIVGLWTDTTTYDIEDVLVVSAGATANATLFPNSDFVATAGSINNGTANITGASTDASLIDVSLAGGSNGFNLNGGAGNAAGLDELIGSAQADTINGGNTNQTALSRDTLTGNGGADVFEFNVIMDDTAILTPLTTTVGVDQELITIAADDLDNANETLTINYTINGIAGAVAYTLGAVDATDNNAVATGLAALLDAAPGISASAAGNIIAVNGDNAGSLTITSVVAGGTFTTLAGAIADGTDVAQVSTLTVSGTPTAGDIYSILVTLVEGTGDSSSATADGTPTTDEIAAGLAANFSVAGITDTAVGSVITFTDTEDNDGGFTFDDIETTAAFGGSGASDIGATDLATADLITDFVSGTDRISFGLSAGSGSTYTEVAEVADFTTARNAADAWFTSGTTRQYYLTSIADQSEFDTDPSATDPVGLLFFDANLDGNVDGVVALMGISSANFAATDIIAA